MTPRKKLSGKAVNTSEDFEILNVPEQVEKSSPQTFPIVGIGASAGGLAAFEAFFSGMPADTDPGMAFVLVQHLAPDHKSILSDLIRRYTRMQVFEVKDGMKVRPNCTYIIPPNKEMSFLGGELQLMEPSSPRGQRTPIDFFSDLWLKTSTNTPSALCFQAPGVTARWVCAPSKGKVAWLWYRILIPQSMMECHAAPLPPDW